MPAPAIVEEFRAIRHLMLIVIPLLMAVWCIVNIFGKDTSLSADALTPLPEAVQAVG